MHVLHGTNVGERAYRWVAQKVAGGTMLAYTNWNTQKGGEIWQQNTPHITIPVPTWSRSLVQE